MAKTKANSPEKASEASAPDEGKEVKGIMISLSKANKLRNLIKVRLSTVDTQIRHSALTSFIIDENDTLETIQQKRQAIIDKTEFLFGLYGGLNAIHTRLRVAIGTANDQSGVNEIINNIEQAKTGLTPLRHMASLRYFSEYEADRLLNANKDIEEQRKLKAEGGVATAGLIVQPYKSGSFYAYPENTPEVNAAQTTQLEKIIRDLEEKRNELNYSTTIHLDQEIVDALTSLSIL